jgi:hypothetical protein
MKAGGQPPSTIYRLPLINHKHSLSLFSFKAGEGRKAGELYNAHEKPPSQNPGIQGILCKILPMFPQS